MNSCLLSFAIGASIPPEIISGSVLGTAFAIGAGKSTAVALTLGIPIASLVLIVKNVCFITILPYLLLWQFHQPSYFL